MEATYVEEWFSDDRFAVVSLPTGAVALDVDAPLELFCGEVDDSCTEEAIARRPTLEEVYRSQVADGVRALAADLSQKHGLGRFWLYQTGHGAHVLFENLLRDWEAVYDVLLDANSREDWFEDGGHAQLCDDAMETQIRVGAKPGRPFDIVPCPGNPNSPPSHIREHDALVAQMLPALRR